MVKVFKSESYKMRVRPKTVEKEPLPLCLQVFTGNLPFLHLPGALVQLPGHPVAKVSTGQSVLHVQDVISLKAQLLLHLRHPVIKCSVETGDTIRQG